MDGWDAESGNNRGVLLDKDIDGDADEKGGCEVEEGAADGAEGGAPDLRAVGFAIAEQAREGRTAHIKDGRIVDIVTSILVSKLAIRENMS